MRSETTEEYLRAILYLEGKNGVARQAQLAEYLGISKAGVSETLSALSARDLVAQEKYSPIALTKKGRRIASRMTFKHRVLEYFLASRLHVPKLKVHEEASRIEHAISDETVNRLYSFLGSPKRDPHGSPITP